MFTSRTLIAILLLNLVGASPTTRAADNREGPVNANASTRKPRVRLLVSIIWEGYDVSAINIRALVKFREIYPDMALTHFLSPAYFLKPTLTPTKVALMQRVFRVHDRIGLYMQPWKSLTEEAGVLFRYKPTFWGTPVAPSECDLDCGRQVPLTIYDNREIQAMFEAGTKALYRRGFADVAGYLTAGWLSSEGTQESAAASGLREDYSAIDPNLIAEKLAGFPILQWARAAWPNVKSPREVRLVKTRAGDLKQFMHVPGIIDYHAVDSIVKTSEAVFDAALERPRLDWTLHLSVIQESASQNIDRLLESVPRLLRLAAEKKVILSYFHQKVTVPSTEASPLKP